jgi:hypothetical protein
LKHFGRFPDAPPGASQKPFAALTGSKAHPLSIFPTHVACSSMLFSIHPAAHRFLFMRAVMKHAKQPRTLFLQTQTSTFPHSSACKVKNTSIDLLKIQKQMFAKIAPRGPFGALQASRGRVLRGAEIRESACYADQRNSCWVLTIAEQSRRMHAIPIDPVVLAGISLGSSAIPCGAPRR